ncbi:MAG: hypothetical protein AAF741_15660 [Bacteroidota bacterium]
MKNWLTFLLAFCLLGCCRCQVANTVDVEYVELCMVDSLPDGTINQFLRIIQFGSLETMDLSTAGEAYTPTGSVKTCEQFDREREDQPGPLDDLYGDCQCAYTISQEAHRVIDIRGGSTQEYDVEFYEVVKRKCGSQETGTEVYRDTLVETGDITSSWHISQTLGFSAPGQFIDDYNIRYYSPGGIQSVVTVDLNPSTVQASYPSLTLNAADFTFDGSNASDIAAAYQQVFQFVIEDLAGTAPSNTFTCFAAFSTSVVVRSNLLHDPVFPYAINYTNDDGNFSIATSSSFPITQAVGAASLTTRTNDYTDECETIWTRMSDIYIRYDGLTPLNLQPELDPNPSLQAGASNPTAFCDVDPAICAQFESSTVDIMGCIELCSDPEYFEVCLADSLNDGSLIRFNRVFDWSDTTYTDFTEDYSGSYTPTGNILTCREADNLDVDTFQVSIVEDENCQVLNIPSALEVTGGLSLSVGNYHSVSISVVEGTVSLNIDGNSTISLPSGYSPTWTAPDPCDYLAPSTFLISAEPNSRAIIILIQ